MSDFDTDEEECGYRDGKTPEDARYKNEASGDESDGDGRFDTDEEEDEDNDPAEVSQDVMADTGTDMGRRKGPPE